MSIIPTRFAATRDHPPICNAQRAACPHALTLYLRHIIQRKVIMFVAQPSQARHKVEAYRELDKELAALLNGERDYIANTANTASLLALQLADLNWVGFYFLRGNDLVLGPFQGKPACIRISVTPLARGVCGAAAATRQTQVVKNVHAFPGHIACDSASNSEIVVPLIRAGRVIGVLDLDSPQLARFDEDDKVGLERLVATLMAATDF